MSAASFNFIEDVAKRDNRGLIYCETDLEYPRIWVNGKFIIIINAYIVVEISALNLSEN